MTARPVTPMLAVWASGRHGQDSLVQRRRRAKAAALGLRSRVKAPFLLPSTRMIPEVVAKSAKFQTCSPTTASTRVEDAVVHVEVVDLVLLAPRLRRERVVAGEGVGAVLGDDDRLALGRPAGELLGPRDLGAGEVAGVDVPAVVAVEHEHVGELRRRGTCRAARA